MQRLGLNATDGPADRVALGSIAGGRTDRRAYWVCGLLLALCAIVYAQTLYFPFLTYDDDGFVYANRHVTGGLTAEGVRWAFTEGPYGEWYPLAPLSHMLDCQLFGVHAAGHHFTNVLLHCASSVALFLVWWRMTEALWSSAFVAAVFALHPLHVESVAWIAERRDVLSGLFFVLTLAAYLGYVRHDRSLGRYLLVMLMLAFGLMSKPSLVTLPPLLLLLDFWPLARLGNAHDAPSWTTSIRQPGLPWLVSEKLPLALLVAGDCFLTMRTHSPVTVPAAWSARLQVALLAPVTYVVKFFQPIDLAVFYPYPKSPLPVWQIVGAIGTLTLISVAALAWRRRQPYVFVGWFWYLGMLTPVLGLVPISDHAMADRYTYLPSIGLSIALTWGAVRLFGAAPLGRRVLAVVAAVAIVAMTVFAARQTSFWCDDEALWRHALACTVENTEAEVSLANALVRQGRDEEAIDHFRLAQQYGNDPAAFCNLGRLLFRQGKLDEAIAEYRRGAAAFPDWYAVEAELADVLARKGDLAEATEHVERALTINSRDPLAHVVRAHILVHRGELDEAAAELQRAIEIAPFNAPAQIDLGAVYFNQGKIKESIESYRAAMTIDPNSASVHANLATSLATLGHIDEALAEYHRALQIDPANRAARAGIDLIERHRGK